MKKSGNIYEDITIREEYIELSKEICQLILVKEVFPIRKIVLAVGGESGSGKTTTAICLEKAFSEKAIANKTIQM